MTEQPPVQPPRQPSGLPVGDSPATQPMPGTDPPAGPLVGPLAGSTAGSPAGSHGGPPAAVPPSPPSPPAPNLWRQATSTHGGRWAIGLAAGALAVLMLLGVVVAGVVVLRGHDRFAMMGQRQDDSSRVQGDQGERSRPGDDPGDDQGLGAKGRNGRHQPGMPDAPGLRGGRGQGQGGLGALLGGAALHGSVSATVKGSVQSLVFQRGAVTAVSSTSITLRSPDGFVGTYGRTAATTSRMGPPVKGGAAFVLARAADKVALTAMALPAGADSASSS